MQNIFRGGKEIQSSRGEIIEISESIYFIVNGAIGLYANNNGSHKLLFTYKTGEIFPFTPNRHSTSSGRTYTFKALSKSELLVLPKVEFDKIAEEPEHTRLLLDYTLQIMQNQIERIDNLQEEQIMQRLLERLIYIGLRFGSQDGDAVAIDIPMSHVDLATSINTSRETVNRYMKQLEELGIISLRRQMIRINSLVEIQKMLNNDTTSVTSKNTNAKGLIVAGLVANALFQSLNIVGTM